jgi:hypothetical protein
MFDYLRESNEMKQGEIGKTPCVALWIEDLRKRSLFHTGDNAPCEIQALVLLFV